jgi:hypothetical protein
MIGSRFITHSGWWFTDGKRWNRQAQITIAMGRQNLIRKVPN